MTIVLELVKLDHELHKICQTLLLAIDQGAMEYELVTTDSSPPRTPANP